MVQDGIPKGIITIENKLCDDAFNIQYYNILRSMKSLLVSVLIKNGISVHLERI